MSAIFKNVLGFIVSQNMTDLCSKNRRFFIPGRLGKRSLFQKVRSINWGYGFKKRLGMPFSNCLRYKRHLILTIQVIKCKTYKEKRTNPRSYPRIMSARIYCSNESRRLVSCYSIRTTYCYVQWALTHSSLLHLVFLVFSIDKIAS